MSSLTTSDQNIFTSSQTAPAGAGHNAARNPFEVARSHLIRRVIELVPPKPIRVFPGPSDFEAVRDLIKESAEIFDDYIRAIGSEVEDNTPFRFDSRSFDACASRAFTDAIYECDNIAEQMRDARDAGEM